MNKLENVNCLVSEKAKQAMDLLTESVTCGFLGPPCAVPLDWTEIQD
jgi:hypothetical protein